MTLFRSRKRPEEREIRWALLAWWERPNSRGWMQTFVIQLAYNAALVVYIAHLGFSKHLQRFG